MEKNLELMGNIVRAIIKSGELLEENPDFPWNKFSMVISVDEQDKLINCYGYCYDEDNNYLASAIFVSEISQQVLMYREWLSKDIDKGFIKMLIQFNRNSGRVAADFEYEDENRWQVTPNNVDQMIEELRPNLD